LCAGRSGSFASTINHIFTRPMMAGKPRGEKFQPSAAGNPLFCFFAVPPKRPWNLHPLHFDIRCSSSPKMRA